MISKALYVLLAASLLVLALVGSPVFFALFALFVLVSAFGLRAALRVRRLNKHLRGLHDELRSAFTRRRRSAEDLLAALREQGYVPGAYEPLEEATTAVAQAEDSGLRELAEANEQLKQALLLAYRGLPPERVEMVHQAHRALAQAEDELDLIRNQYNDYAFFYNRTLRGFSLRVVSAWVKEQQVELCLAEVEEHTFLYRYRMR